MGKRLLIDRIRVPSATAAVMRDGLAITPRPRSRSAVQDLEKLSDLIDLIEAML